MPPSIVRKLTEKAIFRCCMWSAEVEMEGKWLSQNPFGLMEPIVDAI